LSADLVHDARDDKGLVKGHNVTFRLSFPEAVHNRFGFVIVAVPPEFALPMGRRLAVYNKIRASAEYE
jgi:hypothetical protein